MRRYSPKSKPMMLRAAPALLVGALFGGMSNSVPAADDIASIESLPADAWISNFPFAQTFLATDPLFSTPLVDLAPHAVFDDLTTDLDIDLQVADSSNVTHRLLPRWNPQGVVGRMIDDQRAFYSYNSLMQLGVCLIIGGSMANTELDMITLDPIRDNLVNTASDEYAQFLHEHRFLGNGYYLLPMYAGLAVVGKGWGDKPRMPVVGEWSERTLRGIIVGAGPLLIGQNLTGGSRPGESGHGSEWRPLQDDNGISGHSFMGAVPLLTAARMSDRVWLKVVFTTVSALPALSRITDDAHYPSQAFLGWSLAYLATAAIDPNSSSRLQFRPWMDPQSSGLTLSTKW